MVFKQLRLNTLTHTKKTLSTPILFGNPPFSTLTILPVEDPWIYVNLLIFFHAGKNKKQRSPSLVWLFKSGSFHSFSPPSSLNVPMRHKVTTCGLQMSANMQHLAQTCTRLRVWGYYLEHYNMKSRNHPVRGENRVCRRSG